MTQSTHDTTLGDRTFGVPTYLWVTNSDAAPENGAVTIYHPTPAGFDTEEEHTEFTFEATRNKESEQGTVTERLTLEEFAERYEPQETVVGTTDLSEAYRRAQGEVVTREQRARHGVPSASPGHVFEVIHPSGERDYHLVLNRGFASFEQF